MSINTRELHCPLCLKPLNDEDSLLVFKTGLDVASREDRYKTILCRGDFNREITKFGGEYIYLPSARNQICLSHLNCNAENLFWKKEEGSEGQLVFPNGEDRDAELILTCQTTGGKLTRKVTSEIIGTLRETYEYKKTHPNMWFPYPLLRALGKSSLVEMFGSKQVGKTILTLQLAHKNSYLDDRLTMNMNIDSYIFIHNPEDFKRELVIRSDWAERPISRPSSTEPTPGDVRALFIKPSTEPENISIGKEIFKEGRAKFGDGLRRILAELKVIGGFFRNEENGSASDIQEQEERYEPSRQASEILGRDTERFWYSVIFYDTAGESGRKASRKTQRVWQYTDKLVICINAQEIFNQVQEVLEKDESYQRNESIKLACSRMDDLIKIKRDKRKKTCLLVTKLDLIPDDVLGKETSLEIIKQLVERIPENEAQDKKFDSEIRGILRKWLLNNRDAGKRNLIGHLEDEAENLIDKVFFVWTEGLPKMEGVRISPIEKFSPRHGKPGDKVTIYLNKAYFNLLPTETTERGFEKLVKEISFGGIKAVILPGEVEKSDGDAPPKIVVEVPEGAKTDFIGIVTDAEFGGKQIDETTSETVFSLDGDRSDGSPHSYGMLRFLSWCVGVPIQDLVKLRSSQPQESSDSKDGHLEYIETFR